MPRVLLPLLAFAGVLGAEEREAVLWTPVEWSVENASFEGNPFDVEATVIFTHPASDETRRTAMFFDGGTTWRWRFTGTRTGEWTWASESADPDLAGRSGTVRVARGTAEGFLVARGTRFARQVDEDGTLRGVVLNVYMNLREPGDPETPGFGAASPPHYTPLALMDDAAARAAYLGQAREHGCNAVFFQMTNEWFRRGKPRAPDHDSADPDLDTLRALEHVIRDAHAQGLQVVLWMWGDEERHWTPVRTGGLNGAPDRRLQRAIAARLGPLPGWSMGYGFDLEEWASEEVIREWASNLHSRMGWPHLLWARRRSNPELDAVSLDTRWGDFEAGFYPVTRRLLEEARTRPVLFERRFAYMRDGWWTMTRTRRAMWQFAMAGGAAGWWGFYGRSYLAGPGYPAPGQMRAHATFWRDRFLLDFACGGDAETGYVLAHPQKSHFVFYREEAASIRLDLTGMDGPRRAVAVDAARAYEEIDLGVLEPGDHTWNAPRASDWAVAVGDFGPR